MKELKGSRTYDNLMMAFAGETQARTKYSIFASKAKEEGYHQIGRIFEETADNEKEHAEIWFRHLAGLGNTAENLVSAAEGEHYEWSSMYADMAKTAREEGFTEIAKQMEQIADIEKHQERRGLQTKRGEDLDMRQLRTSGDGCGSAGDMSGVPSPAGVFQHKGRELLGHGQHDRRQLVSPEKRKKCRTFMKIL